MILILYTAPDRFGCAKLPRAMPGAIIFRTYGAKKKIRGQTQDAGISIMNNTAEGFERRTDHEFSPFPDIAKGSCGKVRSMYYFAEDPDYIDPAITEVRISKSQNIHPGIASLSMFLRKPTS